VWPVCDGCAVDEAPSSDEAAQELFDDLAAEHLAAPEVSLKRVFRTESLMVHGKIFAMVSDGRLVVKVPAAQAAEIVGAGEGVSFEPRPGRLAKEWICVPPGAGPAGVERWRALMSDARTYVAALATAPGGQRKRRRRPAVERGDSAAARGLLL
jgi:hypothetical protein